MLIFYQYGQPRPQVFCLFLIVGRRDISPFHYQEETKNPGDEVAVR